METRHRWCRSRGEGCEWDFRSSPREASVDQWSINVPRAVLGAATDPDLAGDDAERIRERLARAGLLAPTGHTRRRPDGDAVAAARAAAGRGTQLSDIVASDRA